MRAKAFQPHNEIGIPTDLFIDGHWIAGSTGARIDVENPSDTTVLATVADGSAADAISAVDAAAAAMPSWASKAPRERAELLRRCFERILERSSELAELISLENGKALPDAEGEVAYAAEFFRWFAEEAVRNQGSVSMSPSGKNRILVQHEPIGVCVLVTPWNFPAAMATRKIAPALAAGCTVVLKPATLTPLTALAIAEILDEAGVPRGVVNVVTTSCTPPVVSAMLHDPRVRHLSFTGSTEVGRTLLKESADQVLKCAMELGGNAPLIVLEDADLDVALEGTMVAKMRNGGQACTAANRIYVHRSVHDTFVAQLAARMGSLVVGEATDRGTHCGPLVDRKALAKLTEMVGDAVNSGARVVVGGHTIDRPGYYYQPTVLADVPVDATITREEIFGPVAVVIPFDEDEEVVEAANDTELGLSAYVFGRNLSRNLRIAERLESGMVAINRGMVSDPAAPFGGVKQSGVGREGAHEGMLEFTEPKYIAVDW